MKTIFSKDEQQIAEYRSKAAERRSKSKLNGPRKATAKASVPNIRGIVTVSLPKSAKLISNFSDPQKILGRSKIDIPEYRKFSK